MSTYPNAATHRIRYSYPDLSTLGSATKLRVPHISLVFREMWDTTNLNQMCLQGSNVCRSKAVVYHISQKTSEIWGTLSFVAEPDFPILNSTDSYLAASRLLEEAK
jgi:hypothetical protein